jgi:hypothetical protein
MILSPLRFLRLLLFQVPLIAAARAVFILHFSFCILHFFQSSLDKS